jgi:hypothetical protein
MKPHLFALSLIASTIHLQAGEPAAPAAKPSPAILQAMAKNPKGPAASAVLLPAPNDWRISGGAQYRTFGDASFANRAQAPSFAVPNFSGIPESEGSGGFYTDGYVLPDITGSSTQTWNVGYDSASQVNGNQVTFNGSTSFTQTNGRLHDSTSSQDAAGWGGFVKVESPEVFSWHGLTLSGSLGYSFTRSETDSSLLAYSATQTTTGNAFADTYTSLGGPLPPILNGDFNGPGIVISRIPSRQYLGGGAGGDVIETNLESTIANELTVDLHTLSFGPQISHQPKAAPLRFGASLGFALNIADWEANTEETLRVKDGGKLASWNSESSGTDVLPGFYLELSAELPITAKLSAYAAGRYDWSRGLHGSTALAEHSLDLSGFTAQAGLTFKF